MVVERIKSPTPEQFRRAHHLTVERWPHFAALDHANRFALFEKLGVELVQAHHEDKLMGVCLILPDKINNRSVVWLSNLYARPEARNAGALMLMRIMKWYNTILSTGVTAQAAEVYRALRWQSYDRVWRCVHPIDLYKMAAQFDDYLLHGWMRFGIRLAGFVYHPLMHAVELLRYTDVAQVPSAPDVPDILPDSSDKRLTLVSAYLNAFTTPGLSAALVGTIGRIVHDDLRGMTRLRAFATLRRALRLHGAVMCEHVAISKKQRLRGLWYGVLPLKMPIYYWDRAGTLTDYFEHFEQSNFSFAFCDKIY